MRICYVVCYRDPNYTRSQALIAALGQIPSLDLVVVKNRQRNFLRYVEVPIKLLWTRLRHKPDAFVVGFRADEIFWALYPALVGKPIIFDEFVNLHDWLTSEHAKLKPGSWPIKLVDRYMGWVMSRCRYVLTDTQAHAQLAQQIYGLPDGKTMAIPVGADETIFYPRSTSAESSQLEVFFYGSMLPLHGMNVILESIKLLASQKLSIHFTIAGGRGNPKMLNTINEFIDENKLASQVTHLPWIDYQKLPEFIANADVCLGGPFGGTGQAGRVVAGKTYQFLAMAKPVVIGKISGTSQFIDRQNCLLVEQAKPQDLADALAWCVANPDKLNSIGKAGRVLFENQFSSASIAKTLEKLIQTL